MKWLISLRELCLELEQLFTVHYPDTMPTSQPPQNANAAPVNPDSVMYPWDTQQHCYHNVRVLCDLSGLTLAQKDVICACIYHESRFENSAKFENKDGNGKVWSTDWGICQINDYWHVTRYPDFPSVAYILANPAKAVQFMIDAYKRGALGEWVSYSSGAYKQWLAPNSPMWGLAS